MTKGRRFGPAAAFAGQHRTLAVFVSTRDRRGRDLYRMKADGSTVTRVTTTR